MNLFIVKQGAEQFLSSECVLNNLNVSLDNPGILSTTQPVNDSSQFCFPFWIINNASILKITKYSDAADSISSWFCNQIRDERIDSEWPLFWLSCGENGFTPNVSRQNRLRETLKKRISRISKLSVSSLPPIDKLLSGLFIVESADKSTFYVSREAFFCGQHRMKDDENAPSRSYLKIEEAFTILNRHPLQGEIVADLGAAPGGWTWAALKRGATVYAIDNGPLKKGPLNHPYVHHLCCDAFNWKPPKAPVDWLFCDMVEQPSVVINRIRTWFSEKWCRYAVVNFKYGYTDPRLILESIYDRKGLKPFTETFVCRHLFHDRDEITLMAKIDIS